MRAFAAASIRPALAILVLAATVQAPIASAQDATTVKPADVSEYLSTWVLTGDMAGNVLEFNLDLFNNRGKLNGLLSMSMMPDAQPVEEFELTDEGLMLVYELSMGPQTATIDMWLKIEGETVSGRLKDRGGFLNLDFTGEKAEKAFPAQFASELATEDFADLVGTWKLAVDMQGRSIPVTLFLADAGGKLGAVLDTVFAPEPQVVQHIEKAGTGLLLSFEAQMGPRKMQVAIQVEREGEGVIGTFGDSSGFFSAEFTGGRVDPAADLIARAHFGAAKAKTEGSSEEAAVARGGIRDIRTRFEQGAIRVRYDGATADSSDYERVASLADGEVISFSDSRCTKLFIDMDLDFSGATLETHNFSEDYPGVYSVWIKKEADGWALVFNKQADMWGTQHDSEFDVLSIPLAYATLPDAQPTYSIAFEKGDGGGTVRVAWGEHEWTAPFTL